MTFAESEAASSLALKAASRTSELAIAGGIELANSKIIRATETRGLECLGMLRRTDFLQATSHRKRELCSMRGLLIECGQIECGQRSRKKTASTLGSCYAANRRVCGRPQRLGGVSMSIEQRAVEYRIIAPLSTNSPCTDHSRLH